VSHVMTGSRDLVRGAIENEEEAWSELVKRYSGLLNSIAYSYRLSPVDAADVGQTVWMRLYENIDRIRDPDQIAAWIASVARHECARVSRKAARELLIEQNDTFERASDEGVDRDLLLSERNTLVWEAVNTLPPRSRTLMRLLVDSACPSYERAARKLNMPIGSIGPTRQRCLRILREHPAMVSCRELQYP